MKKIHIFQKKKESDPQPLKIDPQKDSEIYPDISQDPDYQLMLEKGQRGQWDECRQLLSTLVEKYPDNSSLAGYKQDFESQYTIINEIEATAKEEKRKKLIRTLRTLGIITGSLIGVFLIIWYGGKAYQNDQQKKQLQYKANQINTLIPQVEFLLDSGQPEKADELIQRIKAIDPTSPKITELSNKKAEISRIENLYQDALVKLDNGLYSNALVTLMKIESEHPGYKDVALRIEQANSKIKMAQMLKDGTSAYNSGNWQAAIDNFEQVLSLEPANSDATLKTLLANSYLRRIPQLLDNTETTYAEINQAELYYSRANAIIPASNVSSEQENLRVASSNLLALKYSQAADQLINDPSQTVETINQAFSYLRKASSLNTQSVTLQAEVVMVNLYLSGFRYYVEMDWQPAIQQLSEITAIDQSFASGFAKQLLYEAHISQGAQYYSIGSYADAINEYNIADTQASGKDNLLNWYLAEIDMARTLGKIGQYKDANSHFTAALQSVNYEKRAGVSATFISNLKNAVSLYKNGQDENAYKLFTETLVGNAYFNDSAKIDAQQGNCLALIAAHYRSSVQAILEVNKLPRQTIVQSAQTLIIPVIY